ncbi:MAG TPA: peptide chain release factor N(5)-glutamine methyltransferase [Albitalea sp.]|nr:peptide chain release factor N(5)-glutamine methyltransferase [Albitalea sp.]
MSDVTVAAALAEARLQAVERLDAQLLLARTMSCTRSWLIAHDDAPLSPVQAGAYRADLARRAAGQPLAYIVGEKEFHGLTLQVDARVLVPRPDTETLVDWALELLRSDFAATTQPEVIDLGTGSGAIALAVKHACPDAQVTALDASADALEVASANAQRLSLAVDLRQSDWWSAVGGRRFHLALSNPPYVAQHDPHLVALTHEPQLALSSGADGLTAIRQIVAAAPEHLHAGGWLLLEHGHDQASAVQALLAEAGFARVQSRHDLAGIVRCSGGQRPAA